MTPQQRKARSERQRRHSLDRLVRARGQKFKQHWQVNLKIGGSDAASEWMAIHIGLLNERVDHLYRRLRALERKRPNDQGQR